MMQSYPTLDEALIRTTMAIGTALVQWQFIETTMFRAIRPLVWPIRPESHQPNLSFDVAGNQDDSHYEARKIWGIKF